MTPEESAVVDAAIADHSHGCAPEWCGGSSLDPCRLSNAIETLKASRKPIFAWHLRTWADVRASDSIRLPTHPDNVAVVEHAATRLWHVDPSGSQYNPDPLEWKQIFVRLKNHDDQQLTFQPDAPVEIQMDERTYAAMMMLGGWENRIS